ncbi:CDP-glucose 4,6-dehydratase [Cytobacillus praedii]|uniref:CDP-glucose 4,6-dehydratase n=1 Tax=Cytobacillus praedii TaxID=1742358 RepID=A0A4R1ALF2_9BACI|nr:CDP-glucose 4,6-dehydratase [Cytobacillus praedii]TCJ00518.1 CDP-glucose 4,6-dehydratase [Cytobacillus praedii]
MKENKFWKGKKVLVTGHTGFKGTWLTLWLNSLGAEVYGYSLDPLSIPNLFQITDASQECHSCYGDINNLQKLLQYMTTIQPQIIFHLAAQPIVGTSYEDPINTFNTNVLGTAHVLEAARKTKSVKIVINISSDKCYENDDLPNRLFNEEDRLGGNDPYAASKACAELVIKAYRKSYFNQDSQSKQIVSSVRAGNVIGGGDWSKDRLLPDISRAFIEGKGIKIRKPNAVRPWQHVLEPLNGYLLLAEKMWVNKEYSGDWNFGPMDDKYMTVEKLVNLSMELWGKKINVEYDSDYHYESTYLKLDSSKAIQKIGWRPKLTKKESIEWTVQWYKNYISGNDMKLFTLTQIKDYQSIL